MRQLPEIETLAAKVLMARGHHSIAQDSAARCAWLHGAGYNGLGYLAEALNDEVSSADIEKDLMGLDLKGVSCVFIAPQVEALFQEHGRVFLRNVRHGLFLLPTSVTGNYGIGCPVDPNFALGGERTKNPYTEKLELAALNGVDVDEALWQSLSEIAA